MPEPTYPPLDTLKPVAGNVWIVDGEAIPFGPGPFKVPFPTRMTVIRLDDGGLFIHSPTPLRAGVKAEIDAIGPVRFLIAPNRIHYWWVPEWRSAYPEAVTYLAARIREQAGDRIAFDAPELAAPSRYPWDAEIATLPVAGRFMTEVVFFHRSSRSLILTDLIENFEPERMGWFMGLLTRLGGTRAPDGQMPRDMRLTFPDKAGLRRAIDTMIGWDPERVLLAHGRWFDRDGAAALRHAFRWLDG